ncbi:MAG: dockerin type I domain-containing protein, partial [Oscillospiraceae bacterium]|nr:dockerin type I domain-containing protein [Oscillospiraceae bacterium]
GDVQNIPGDVNGDGFVNASDASDILAEYALISSGEPATFSDIQKISADFNNDGLINSSDASEVLAYYAEISSGKQ